MYVCTRGGGKPKKDLVAIFRAPSLAKSIRTKYYFGGHSNSLCGVDTTYSQYLHRLLKDINMLVLFIFIYF